MKNKFLILLLLIPLISATMIYSGEEISLILDKEYSYYSIIGNTTPINLIVTQDGMNVTIKVNKYQQTNNFTIIFFDKDKEVITQYSSGGGGSSTRTINRTEYIEIPKFYDRNNTIVEYITNESIVEKEINKITLKEYIFFGLFILIGLVSLGWIIFRKIKEDLIEDERGYKNNE